MTSGLSGTAELGPTVRVNVQVPLLAKVSLSVPDTVYWAATKVLGALMAPEADTVMLGLGLVVVKVTMPDWPDTASWPAKAVPAAALPVVGVSWVIVPGSGALVIS